MGEEFEGTSIERPMPVLIKEMARSELNNEPPHELRTTTLAPKAHIDFHIIGGGTTVDWDLVKMVNTYLRRLKITVSVREIFNGEQILKEHKKRPLMVDLIGKKTWYEEGYYSAWGNLGWESTGITTR